MIRYGLLCEAAHRFDGWFRSSADFDAQAARGLLSCPVCGSVKVEKALMAPAIASRRSGRDQPKGEEAPSEAPAGEVALLSEKETALRAALAEVRKAVTERSEDVGDRFPALARQMHTEEIEHRSIRGRASPEEARALVEEGVAIQPLPRFPDETN